jgi:hypothetical protein
VQVTGNLELALLVSAAIGLSPHWPICSLLVNPHHHGRAQVCGMSSDADGKIHSRYLKR